MLVKVPSDSEALYGAITMDGSITLREGEVAYIKLPNGLKADDLLI